MKLCYACHLCFVVLSSVLDAQTTNTNRFRDPEGITADPTGLYRDTSVRVRPKLPRNFVTSRVTGAPVAAFVIDTTGRVEMETASFVRTSSPELMKAACDLLGQFRFQPFMVGDQKWRVLLVESFAFTILPEPDTVATNLAARTQEDFATKPIGKVVEQLRLLPHCDSPGIQ